MRILLLALLLAPAALTAQSTPPPALHWYRGNTHAHTSESDGDSSPLEVARWYKQQGYQFTFITDHEKVTDIGPLNAAIGEPGKFLVVAGQEVTQILPDSTHPDKRRQGHMNSLLPTRVVLPQGGANLEESYRRNLAAIVAAGGLPQVNHPNWRWSTRPGRSRRHGRGSSGRSPTRNSCATTETSPSKSPQRCSTASPR